jgi:hypothetical protein
MVLSMSSPKRRRGRPKKIHRGRRLTSTVNEWCDHTHTSRSTAFREMAAGHLRYIQHKPGAPRLIPHSEYRRRGFDLPDDSDFIIVERKAADNSATA